ncbi:MAG: hypothetical protein AAB584_02045 [Patescibacteria group bacterium]
MNSGINLDLKKFFWDVNPDTLDFKKNSEYIIARILEYGDPETLGWLFKTYNKEIIIRVLREKRGFSRKTANFWSKILDVNKNEIQCLKKFYQETRKIHWPY